MTAIEKHNEARFHAQDAAELARRANPNLPHDCREYYDKLGVTLIIKETWAGAFGSSSTHSWGDILRRQFEQEIKLQIRSLIMSMAERMAAEAEQLRIAAADEAREILKEVDA